MLFRVWLGRIRGWRIWVGRVWRCLTDLAIVCLSLWAARETDIFAAGNGVILATAEECRVLASEQLLTGQAAANVRPVRRRSQLLAGGLFAVEIGLEVAVRVHPELDPLVAGLEVRVWIHLDDLLASLLHMNEHGLGLCIAGAKVEGQGR